MNGADTITKHWYQAFPGGWRGLIIVSSVGILAFIFGALLTGGNETMTHDETAAHTDVAAEPSVWTCSMHPQIKLPEPGQCPICFMDLIPLEDESADLGPRQLRMSASALELAKIQTAVVRRGEVSLSVRLAGRLAVDESRRAIISAWAPGRLERLSVDYTGAVVERGQPLVTIYSPELYSAQQEAIEARRVLERLKPGAGMTLRATAEATLEATRTKLRLWGLSADQIEEIESSAAPSEEVVIRAPIGGVVTHFNAREGMYVSTGSALYTIADLGTLWVQFDAYETDLPWLRVGDTVSFTTTAFPGEVFYGKLSFIDPVVDPMRRTVQVRADVDNSDGRLKPEMLARGTIAASYTRAKSGAESPLLIPASAPLLTGKRAVVYVLVSESEDEGMIFEGREVELGPRSDGFYSVSEGLAEGERVVTHGAFKLDSELQIQAKPSMMNPEGTDGAPPGHDHGAHAMAAPVAEVSDAARAALTPVYNAYFTTQMALANDDLAAAQAGYGELTSVVGDVDMSVFSDHNAHLRWMELSAVLLREASRGQNSEDLEVARDAFFHLSNAAIDLHKTFGHSDSIRYYLTFCPMARDNTGAYWLQTTDVIWNSYWGERMLRCGSVKDSLEPAP